jgi:hypothetical protein
VWPYVIAIMLAILILTFLGFRWFQRYKYTDAWRKGEFRSAAFGMVLWLGGILGHRLQPPPETKIEFLSGQPQKDGPSEKTEPTPPLKPS